MFPRSVWGRGRGARSPSSHLEATGRGENQAPTSCTAPVPTSIRKTHSLLAAQIGAPRSTEEISEPFAPRRSGSPPRAWVARRRPAQPWPHTKALEPRSMRSRPAGSGHLRIPAKATDPFSPKCSHPHPGLAHPVPSPADSAAGWGGFLYIRPSAGSPFSPDLLTRIRRHSSRTLPRIISFSRTNPPLLFGSTSPIITIIPRFHAFVVPPNVETG